MVSQAGPQALLTESVRFRPGQEGPKDQPPRNEIRRLSRFGQNKGSQKEKDKSTRAVRSPPAATASPTGTAEHSSRAWPAGLFWRTAGGASRARPCQEDAGLVTCEGARPTRLCPPGSRRQVSNASSFVRRHTSKSFDAQDLRRTWLGLGCGRTCSALAFGKRPRAWPHRSGSAQKALGTHGEGSDTSAPVVQATALWTGGLRASQARVQTGLGTGRGAQTGPQSREAKTTGCPTARNARPGLAGASRVLTAQEGELHRRGAPPLEPQAAQRGRALGEERLRALE